MLSLYAECHYTERHVAYMVMLSVVKKSVIMLSVVVLSAFMLSAIMLSRYAECRYAECRGAWYLDATYTRNLLNVAYTNLPQTYNANSVVFVKKFVNLSAGNTYLKVRLSTVYLLIKVACFGKR
jgi:hypothetical protein